jgi:hypothetical protein
VQRGRSQDDRDDARPDREHRQHDDPVDVLHDL